MKQPARPRVLTGAAVGSTPREHFLRVRLEQDVPPVVESGSKAGKAAPQAFPKVSSKRRRTAGPRANLVWA